MADETKVDSGSKERVAYDLMRFVAHATGARAPHDEAGILALYHRCHQVVSGIAPKAE